MIVLYNKSKCLINIMGMNKLKIDRNSINELDKKILNGFLMEHLMYSDKISK